MIVCVCHGLSHRTIEAALRDGATTVRAVGEACRAGTDCGCCKSQIRQMIREHVTGTSGQGMVGRSLLPCH